MKTLVLMFLALTSACAFSQQPKIRLEKLSDAEYSAYRQASDARETAARAYLHADKDLDGVRAMIEDKHKAREITPSCDSHYRRTSEWKGQYIIIDETDESDSPGITTGCASFYVGPAVSGSSIGFGAR